MKIKQIELFNKLTKTSKKKFHEEIFMPKFFLNLLNLSKKAKKLGRNSLNLLDQDYILNSNTYFEKMDNIPSINIQNVKNDNYKKIDNNNKNQYKKIKFISALNSPGRVIIKPPLPKISYQTNTLYSFYSLKNNDNNKIINDKIIIKKDDVNNACINLFPSQLSYSSNINKHKSCSILNNHRNNRELNNINNSNTSNTYSIRIKKINSDNKHINIKIDESSNLKNKEFHIPNSYYNQNNMSINNLFDIYLKDKLRKIHSRKTIINVKKLKNLKKDDNQNKINNYTYKVLKDLTIKTNSSFQKKSLKIISPLRRTLNISTKFRNSDEISYFFLNKKIINYSINSNIALNNQTQPPIFYYYINKMYRNQIADYMSHRINWKYIENNNINKIKINNEEQKININFEWKYFSNRLNYKNYKYELNIPVKKLRMINLFEKNYEIGNKKNMFLNLITYCDKIKYNIFEIVPFTLIISYKKDLVFAMKSLKELIEFIDNNKDNNKENDIVSEKKYNEYFWYDKNFEKISNQIIYINKNFISEKNYWIIKPTDLYQGKYIEICNTFDDIYRICINMFKGVNEALSKEEDEEEDNQNNDNLNKQQKTITKKSIYSKMYCCNDIIIQKYLDNPLLYKKRKFDIRCFVLLDSNLNLFYCKEGHLKGSSELYNVKSQNKFIHITNYSFQKKSSKFQKYEEGNEISYNDFKLFLQEEKIPLEKFDIMIEQIKFLIKVSFKSVSKKLYKLNNVLCFELFGYDFIIDNDFKPWILEINNNPGLGISSPVIKKIIPRMMDDAFRLTIDKVFETKYSDECIDINGHYKSRFPIEGYNDEENIFEFLCNIK